MFSRLRVTPVLKTMRTSLQFNKTAHGTFNSGAAKRRDKRKHCSPAASHFYSIPSSTVPFLSLVSVCIKLVLKCHIFCVRLLHIFSFYDSWHIYLIPECFSSNIICMTIFPRLWIFIFIFILPNFVLLSSCFEEWPHSLFLISRV